MSEQLNLPLGLEDTCHSCGRPLQHPTKITAGVRMCPQCATIHVIKYTCREPIGYMTQVDYSDIVEWTCEKT